MQDGFGRKAGFVSRFDAGSESILLGQSCALYREAGQGSLNH